VRRGDGLIVCLDVQRLLATHEHLVAQQAAAAAAHG
jgi:hypothetical protein